MLEVKRSPARVSWHVLFNGQFFDARPTKAEAKARLINCLRISR